MTFQEIQAAVDSNRTVHYSSAAYTVVKHMDGKLRVVCKLNGMAVPLTEEDVKRYPEKFFFPKS